METGQKNFQQILVSTVHDGKHIINPSMNYPKGGNQAIKGLAIVRTQHNCVPVTGNIFYYIHCCRTKCNCLYFKMTLVNIM